MSDIIIEQKLHLTNKDTQCISPQELSLFTWVNFENFTSGREFERVKK